MLAIPGATLSRWTLAYFAAAVAFLLLGEALMVLGFGYPIAGLRAPQTLILVHCITIGWLSLLMCGALFQFVPVLVAGPIYSNSLPLPALLLILGGLALLIASFLQLAGVLPPLPAVFLGASLLLGAGFLLVLWTLGRTLAAAWPLNLPAQFVSIGLASVAATISYGIIFTLGFGGYSRSPLLLGIQAQGLSLHVSAGLGGWLTFTAIGVSHRLLSMFMLSPELDGPTTRWTFRLGTLALAILVGAGTIVVAAGGGPGTVLVVAGITGLACLALYGRDVLRLYRQRVRPAIELNSRMAAVALAHLAFATLLLSACAAAGVVRQYIGPLLFLIAFGWLSGLGLAKLYKIVAFVTWLECYGPVLGKAPTPRVQDLVVEPRAARWFWLYFAAVDVASLCLLLEAVPVFRVAAAPMLLASAGIALELVRTRRLANVGEELRLPAGAQQPRLLFTFVGN